MWIRTWLIAEDFLRISSESFWAVGSTSVWCEEIKYCNKALLTNVSRSLRFVVWRVTANNKNYNFIIDSAIKDGKFSKKIYN